MRDGLGMHPLIAQAQLGALAADRLRAAEARRTRVAARAADRAGRARRASGPHPTSA